jgi:hypothetical protein
MNGDVGEFWRLGSGVVSKSKIVLQRTLVNPVVMILFHLSERPCNFESVRKVARIQSQTGRE